MASQSQGRLTADDAMQAFATLRDDLHRIGDQIQAAETGATTKTLIVLDTIADVRKALSAQADAIDAQGGTAGAVAAGLDRALTLLDDLATNAGKPIPATAADLVDGFGATRSALVAIEVRLEQAIALSESGLTADKAGEAFGTLRDAFEQIGTRLDRVEAGALQATAALDAIGAVDHAVSVQAATVGAVASGMGQALTLLTALESTEGKPIPATLDQVSEGFDAIKSALAGVDGRVAEAVALSCSSREADQTSQAFVAQAFSAVRDDLVPDRRSAARCRRREPRRRPRSSTRSPGFARPWTARRP